jgi:hypothetical protein
MRFSREIVRVLLLALSIPNVGFRWAFATDTMLRGSTLANPELLSGSWETNEFATVVGIHIKLTTKVAGAPSSLVGIKQVFNDAEIQVYQRDDPKRVTGDGNWFTDDSPGVQWTGRHLIIAHAALAGTPVIRLDLIFDPVHNAWKGQLRRGTFDHDVTLVRPRPKAGIAKSPFAGTWYREALMNNCLHIVQTGEGTLSGWSDDLVTPGRIRYANGIKRPTETIEQYGSIALVQIESPTTLLLELKAFSAICCSIVSGLQLPDGNFGLQAAPRSKLPRDMWRRVQGSSCVADVSKSK